jgi:hypothetical protein
VTLWAPLALGEGHVSRRIVAATAIALGIAALAVS